MSFLFWLIKNATNFNVVALTKYKERDHPLLCIHI